MNVNPEFRIIHKDCWGRDDFIFTRIAGKRSYDEPTKDLIRAAWAAARINPHLILFNGRVLSLLEADLRENPATGRSQLCLQVQYSDYKSFYGTNLSNPYRLGKEKLTNPLAACAIVETLEGTVFVGERNPNLAEVSGFWHVPGGTLDGVINPIDFMSRELSEELGITAKDIQSAVCLGLAENLIMRKPEFLCYFHLSISEQEVVAKLAGAVDKHEHKDYVFVPVEELADFVLMHPFAPIGKAAVQLYLEFVNSHA